MATGTGPVASQTRFWETTKWMDDLHVSYVICCFVRVYFQPARGEENIVDTSIDTKRAGIGIPSDPNS